MSFEIPRGVMTPFDEIDVRLDPSPHPFELRNAEAIEKNWQAEHAANPALFDGTMVLLSSLRLEGRRLSGTCHAVRYATMLYWRRNRGDPDIEHCFAYPALVTGDNALLAIRMGQHTTNAGFVYFAAGSLEPEDFVGGKVDAYGNMRRELREETGLDLDAARPQGGYMLYSLNHITALFRLYRFEAGAEELAASVRAFVAGEAEPEIEGPVVIRADEPRPDRLQTHMAEIVDWYFGEVKA